MGPSCVWHEITHFLSSQQDQREGEDSENGPSWTWHVIIHLLSSQQDQSIVRRVRRYPGGPGMKSLTPCQAHRTRVGARTMRMRMDPPIPGMKILTPYQTNRSQGALRTVRKNPAGLDSPAVMARVSENSEMGSRWTWHEITHCL